MTDRSSVLGREVDAAAELMLQYADRTGLSSRRRDRRYLWTDAFAVCNYLGLAIATGDGWFLDTALRLVDLVHDTLGRHRPDDAREGWISGLSESEGRNHPTAGGLRIGKPLPERQPGEAFDDRLEWERDGQYLHYLTKWMHALDQVARFTGEARFNVWARELAEAAYRGFSRGAAGAGDNRLAWKMSIDLSRPLVPSMGQHDPLDGYVTCRQLQDGAARLHINEGPALSMEVAAYDALTRRTGLATTDPLGIGGLLMDGCRLIQVADAGNRSDVRIASDAFASALGSLQHPLSTASLGQPVAHRLAFRELGLAIGLAGIEIAQRCLDKSDAAGFRETGPVLDALSARARRIGAISAFWRAAPRGPSWSDHEDINEVMLATSLLPGGFLLIRNPASS
jgi:hypothetical protein